ncbi:conserved hypothetical protein [Gloeothece citriformis PCC 7424]|uniref:Uncharacterized protein n=1 Tax=Gloeothece citriformis (strain PCC 7424) TaxID=65393 RepID=B7KAP4_GLOC7|nr:hypothetical protein [Gloeothece citriformis]ACK68716.1 conserved hypothetical protein [Gloeothece citriformis PCC 7424]
MLKRLPTKLGLNYRGCHQGILSGIIILTHVLNGCAETKSLQCQKIFKIADEMTQETKTLTNSGQEINMKTWLVAADELEQGAQDMEKIEISDQTLQQYQVGFAEVYQDYAEATREIVKAWETKDRIAGKSAQEKVRRANKRERELGEKINTYCQGD